MPRVDLVVESELSRSPRVRQLEAMFDVPPAEKCRLQWSGDVPIEAEPWNIGLIVGPSGCGKTSIARKIFPQIEDRLEWSGRSVIDDFAKTLSMDQISEICSAVGFNTIPAWMRPYSVLSNGERFRVELARKLAETQGVIAVDEFTSVVDRQVAQIGSHAVQKWVRKHDRQFVAVSCHYDIIDWLQPDWILEPTTMAFTPRRGLRRRPALDVSVQRVHHSAWKLFAPFHYLTAELVKSAKCFVLFVGDRPASFAGVLPRPIGRWDRGQSHIWGLSRLVTLPDWQGLGLAMILAEKLGAAWKAIGDRFHTYPAHPSLIRSFDRSPLWAMERRPGVFSSRNAGTAGSHGGRPCAVFSYRGETMNEREARQLVEGSGVDPRRGSTLRASA